MKLKETFFLLSVITVVFLAGCAKQASVATAGVVIEKFASQISAVPSNSPVEFTLIVKNTGEREATEVKAVLGGLTFLPSSVTDQTEQQKYWKSGEGKAFTEFLQRITKGTETLLGEDIQSGFKGDQGSASWRLKSPIQARDQTYEATVNLVYNYPTISTILIKAVDFNYFQSLPESEQQKIDTGVIVSKTTKGPIEVSVKTNQAIISGSSTLPIEIEFNNVGGGRTFLGGGGETTPEDLYSNIKKVDERVGLNKILVELPPDMSCSLKSSENPQNKNKIYEVRLIEGKRGRILCNKVIGGISTTQSLSIDIKAEYRYLIEGKTLVKVSKTLYQPPILDISLEDSTVNIIHDHFTQATHAVANLIIKNVGNQKIEGTNVDINYNIAGESGTKESVLSPTKTLESFERTPPVGVVVRMSGISVSYNLVTDPEQITKSIDSQQLKDENTKNNRKSDTITLDYDIAVKDLKAKVKDAKTFSVEITATVANNGKNVAGFNIPFEIKVDNELVNHESCEKNNLDKTPEKVVIIHIAPLERQEITCIYHNPNKKQEFEITAIVAPSELETNKQNNIATHKFTSLKLEIVPGSSNGRLSEIGKVFLLGKFKYTLATQIRNSGTLPVETVSVEFKDSSEKSLCKTSQIILQPEETNKLSCDTEFLATEKFDAKAAVVGAVIGDTFRVDSKIKLLTLADVREPFSTWFISPLIFTDKKGDIINVVSDVYQSFKFSKEFQLTRVNISLVQPTVAGNKLVLKILDDSNGGTGSEIESSPVLPTIDPNNPFVVIGNYADFSGITLKADTVYWIEIRCEAPCTGDKYGWKFSKDDVYTDGNGFVFTPSHQSLPNNGDFGFHVYGIEK